MSSTENNVAGLAILAPAAHTFTHSSGETYRIGALKMGQLAAFAEAIKPFAGQFAAIANGEEVDVLGMMVSDGAALIQAASIASGIDKAELEQWDLADFASLTLLVVRVNLDFFVRRLLPMLKQELGSLRAEREKMPAATSGTPA